MDHAIPKPKYSVDDMFDDDMKSARRRAERAITEDGFLDSNIKFPRPVIANDFDDEVCMSCEKNYDKLFASTIIFNVCTYT